MNSFGRPSRNVRKTFSKCSPLGFWFGWPPPDSTLPWISSFGSVFLCWICSTFKPEDRLKKHVFCCCCCCCKAKPIKTYHIRPSAAVLFCNSGNCSTLTKSVPNSRLSNIKSNCWHSLWLIFGLIAAMALDNKRVGCYNKNTAFYYYITQIRAIYASIFDQKRFQKKSGYNH